MPKIQERAVSYPMNETQQQQQEYRGQSMPGLDLGCSATRQRQHNPCPRGIICRARHSGAHSWARLALLKASTLLSHRAS